MARLGYSVFQYLFLYPFRIVCSVLNVFEVHFVILLFFFGYNLVQISEVSVEAMDC